MIDQKHVHDPGLLLETPEGWFLLVNKRFATKSLATKFIKEEPDKLPNQDRRPYEYKSVKRGGSIDPHHILVGRYLNPLI